MILKRQIHRSTDDKKQFDRLFFRSNRCFKSNEKWFFETREKQQVGPFDTIQQCEEGCKRYIESIVKDGKAVQYAVNIANKGTWNVLTYK